MIQRISPFLQLLFDLLPHKKASKGRNTEEKKMFAGAERLHVATLALTQIVDLASPEERVHVLLVERVIPRATVGV